MSNSPVIHIEKNEIAPAVPTVCALARVGSQIKEICIQQESAAGSEVIVALTALRLPVNGNYLLVTTSQTVSGTSWRGRTSHRLVQAHSSDLLLSLAEADVDITTLPVYSQRPTFLQKAIRFLTKGKRIKSEFSPPPFPLKQALSMAIREQGVSGVILESTSCSALPKGKGADAEHLGSEENICVRTETFGFEFYNYTQTGVYVRTERGDLSRIAILKSSKAPRREFRPGGQLVCKQYVGKILAFPEPSPTGALARVFVHEYYSPDQNSIAKPVIRTMQVLDIVADPFELYRTLKELKAPGHRLLSLESCEGSRANMGMRLPAVGMSCQVGG